jgi:hypothetical protein
MLRIGGITPIAASRGSPAFPVFRLVASRPCNGKSMESHAVDSMIEVENLKIRIGV